MSKVTYRMVNEVVDSKIEEVRKLKKAEIVEFARALLKEYYLELPDETIKEIYYDN